MLEFKTVRVHRRDKFRVRNFSDSDSDGEITDPVDLEDLYNLGDRSERAVSKVARRVDQFKNKERQLFLPSEKKSMVDDGLRTFEQRLMDKLNNSTVSTPVKKVKFGHERESVEGKI